MPISEDTIERIKLSNSIESVVREYLPDLKRAGRNWKACCPFHNEKTPSFVVSPEKGIFKCFGCNAVGDVFKFLMLADNISWIEAVKKLAVKANIEIQETKQDIIKTSEKTKLFSILENSAIYYHRCLLESSSAKEAREYLKKRGVIRETVNKFKLGFSPKGQFLQSALKKGYTNDDLLKAGLIIKTKEGDFFECMSGRIVFPIFDIQGRVVAFGGRTIADHEIKYLNSPETVVYSKSSNLYGLFQTLPEIRKERKMIVLEGYTDVIIPQQFGITGAVATLGTSFTQSHAKLVSRYSDSVTLLFDSDDAGRAAAQRSLEILVESGIECRVSALPEHVDADEYLNRYGKENFLKLLEDSSKSAIDFMIARVCGGLYSDGKKSSPEMKAKTVSALLDFISRNPDSIIQREWIKCVAQHIDVDEEAAWRNWGEFKKKQRLKLKDLDKQSVESKKVSMSLEENLLNLILNNKGCIEEIDPDRFEDARCKRVFELIVSGSSDSEILNVLPEEDRNWFSELILNTIEYNDIEEALGIILKDIEVDRLERKRQQLKKEILLMDEGKREKDKNIFDEYEELTILLKGSRKLNGKKRFISGFDRYR
ncbi:MAG: DNA primase [Endomicrobium sp.]|jgi:DNA primase|nr:DNA primase [Endomicrobium sp.]